MAGLRGRGALPLKLNIGNAGEFYEPNLAPLDERARRRWRSSALAMGGAALLWNLPKAASAAAVGVAQATAAAPGPTPAVSCGHPGRVVVVPAQLDEGLTLELDERLGLGGVEVVVPRPVGNLLCADLLRDEGALARIVELARLRGGAVEVAAWGETPGLCALLRELAQRGLCVRGLYGRRGNLNRTARLDSKAGLRELSRRELRRLAALLPEGAVSVNGVGEAAALARSMAVEGAVVVKAALSTAGVGQVRIDRGRYGVKELTRRLEFAARAAPELKAWPLVVERYHRPPVAAAGQGAGYSVQCVADGAGGAHVLFTAVQAEVGGVYCSALGIRAVGAGRAGELELLGEELGRQLSGWGYSGIFGADFVADEGGGLKLVEVNARRTTLSAGGELLALAIAGGGEGENAAGVVLFIERAAQGSGRLSWQEQKKRLSGLLFTGGGAQGWVPLPAPLPPSESESLPLPDSAAAFNSEAAEAAGAAGASSSGFVVAPTTTRAVEMAKMVCAALGWEP